MTIEEILTQDDVVSSINNNLEYLTKEIPEIKNMFNFDQHHPHHHLDVWKHTMLALAYSNNDFMTRLVLLLHDLGKPFCYQDEYISETEFIRHFRGHADVSTKMAKEILERLGYDEKIISEALYLIKYHDIEITMEDIENNPILTSKRLHIQECDSRAHHPDHQQKRLDYVENVKELLKEVTMDKKDLREKYKKVRKDIPDKEQKSEEIFNQIINDPIYKEANVIALYNSTKDEVDTHKLIEYSRSLGKTVLLPRTVNFDLIFFGITDDTKFQKSEFGVLEPIGGLAYPPNKIDLVIVPGIAFDKEGNRIGYGGGYYDRYLEWSKLPSMAICFQEQISDDKIPTSETDMKVDIIRTDKELYYCAEGIKKSKKQGALK